MDSSSALVRYIQQVNDAIEARKFFGKSRLVDKKIDQFNNIDDSIGAYVTDLLAKGEITVKQEKELTDIGKILVNLNELNAAEKAFQEILASNPQNIQAKAYLVDIYGNQKMYDKSIEILKDWIEKNPDDMGAKKRLEEYKKRNQNTSKDELELPDLK